jgi:hypothetical protein
MLSLQNQKAFDAKGLNQLITMINEKDIFKNANISNFFFKALLQE